MTLNVLNGVVITNLLFLCILHACLFQNVSLNQLLVALKLALSLICYEEYDINLEFFYND